MALRSPCTGTASRTGSMRWHAPAKTLRRGIATSRSST
jgi:hypothetical protein